MNVLLPAKFEVSSIILISFRQGVIFTPPPKKNKPLKTIQNKPLKSPSRLGLSNLISSFSILTFVNTSQWLLMFLESIRLLDL